MVNTPIDFAGGKMRYLLFSALALSFVSIAVAEEPIYVLEYPGIAFDWLTLELSPPVEGTLSEESGSVASSATSSGVEYHFDYWFEEMTGNDRRGDWLTERLQSVLPPDSQEGLQIGDLTWSEGSMKSPQRLTSSLGLVVSVNFNFITEDGAVLARGKAYAIFVNGYSVLLWGIAPAAVVPTAGNVLDEIVSWAYLTD
jgi:hypothetical protein